MIICAVLHIKRCSFKTLKKFLGYFGHRILKLGALPLIEPICFSLNICIELKDTAVDHLCLLDTLDL